MTATDTTDTDRLLTAEVRLSRRERAAREAAEAALRRHDLAGYYRHLTRAAALNRKRVSLARRAADGTAI